MPSTATTIAEQVEGLNAASAERLPADILAAFGASLARLNAAGVPADAAKTGTSVPDVALIDAHGAPTSLHAVTAGRPTVLAFYRGAWCPYCNIALRTYSDQLLAKLTERGVGLVAISPQKPDGSLSMQEKHDLAFPVLSDAGNALASQLGILSLPAGEDVRAAQGQLGLDVTTVNADGSDTLPMPTVLFLDADNEIGWIDVRPDYTARIEVADILAGVDSAL
jgi:peroxiredoxin